MKNKTIKISQLHLRLFLVILALFICAKFSYRALIERHEIEEALGVVIAHDIDDIRLSALRHVRLLASINRNFAISDAAYRFVEEPYFEYLAENATVTSFKHLGIDGIIFLDPDGNIVFSKGVQHRTEQPISFEFIHDNAQTGYKYYLQKVYESGEDFTGVLNTQHGPAFVAMSPITRSDGSGDNRGMLLFIRLIEQPLLDKIALETHTQIIISDVNDDMAQNELADWREVDPIRAITPVNHRAIHDMFGTPIGLLTITHLDSEMPPWIDERSGLYIFIFSLLLWFVYMVFSSKIFLPIKRFEKRIEQMDIEGKLTTINVNTGIKELDHIVEHFNGLVNTVAEQKAKLSEQALFDTLTELPNRRSFNLHIEKLGKLYQRHGIGFAVVLADVDFFKSYNDTLGHLAGDEALKDIAQHLNQFFKREHDLCSRYGGEEFIMVYSDVSILDLNNLLTRLVNSFAELALPHPSSDIAPHLTVSFGASILVTDTGEGMHEGVTIADMINEADQALYHAKESGRNQFAIRQYNEEVEQQYPDRSDISEDD